jgi:hypothetical protein
MSTVAITITMLAFGRRLVGLAAMSSQPERAGRIGQGRDRAVIKPRGTSRVRRVNQPAGLRPSIFGVILDFVAATGTAISRRHGSYAGRPATSREDTKNSREGAK